MIVSGPPPVEGAVMPMLADVVALGASLTTEHLVDRCSEVVRQQGRLAVVGERAGSAGETTESDDDVSGEKKRRGKPTTARGSSRKRVRTMGHSGDGGGGGVDGGTNASGAAENDDDAELVFRVPKRVDIGVRATLVNIVSAARSLIKVSRPQMLHHFCAMHL